MQDERHIKEVISQLIEALVAGDDLYTLEEDDVNKSVELEDAYQQRTAVQVLRWVLGENIRQELTEEEAP